MNSYAPSRPKGTDKYDRSGTVSRKELAAMYGISPKTLKARLDALGIELPGGAIFPKWQKKIYEALGYPPGISKHDFEAV